jgi:hypothetical protein
MRVDDELREQRVIHVLELVINHTRSSHGHNHVTIITGIAVGSIDAKIVTKSDKVPFVLG